MSNTDRWPEGSKQDAYSPGSSPRSSRSLSQRLFLSSPCTHSTSISHPQEEVWTWGIDHLQKSGRKQQSAPKNTLFLNILLLFLTRALNKELSTHIDTTHTCLQAREGDYRRNTESVVKEVAIGLYSCFCTTPFSPSPSEVVGLGEYEANGEE